MKQKNNLTSISKRKLLVTALHGMSVNFNVIHFCTVINGI